MMVSRIGIAASFVLAMAIGSAQAQQQGGVIVGGNVDQNVQTGDVTNSVKGQGARGTVNVGSLAGNVTVGGNVNQKAKTGDITNKVEGKGACGNVNIASATSETCK